ncbi:glycoside hydrolase family 5 protein [Gelatoporia subvermispora B]|uniref:Glycoside hydrolase family 5 protein n=1 Tax=Ceriporiopsis subvermispora (strain B) TaxID=914234 RepID=M2PKD2_CERS8|nr:glycoside hydrolase family 5 protein [Gelatoporia subvermispora B]
MLYVYPFLYLLPFLWLVQANDFAGASSYFLYAVSDDDRDAVLDAMQSANMKLLRIFITQVAVGTKGSSASAVNDLETVQVGNYDDTILRQIDNLAAAAHAKDIKLVIAMHDRYALGCWTTDAYVAKYDLPTTNCEDGVPDSSAFYTNSGAITDFDNRLAHILNFESPNFGVPWYQLSDAIFAFEPENESQGHMDQVAPDWLCDRAEFMRSIIGSWGVQISTGGGTDLPTSTQSQFFSCDDIQIIAIHDYNIDPSYVASGVDAVKPSALSSGKRLLYEEFGAEGSTKQPDIEAVTNTLISTGVPWMYWEITKPGAGSSNYEVWTDEPSWVTLQSQSITTGQQSGEFSWPEID